MNEKFSNRLQEYLESECSDYNLTFSWEWDDSCECCNVTIKRDNYTKLLRFKYDELKDDLAIEVCEDCYYTTREFDYTVKYFWMLISPTLFPEL